VPQAQAAMAPASRCRILQRRGCALKLQELNEFNARKTTLSEGRLLAGLLLLLPSLAAGASSPFTVLTATQRREVTSVLRGDDEMVAIEDVVAGFGTTMAYDPRADAATFQRGKHEIVLHNKKSLASVDGDLKLLSAPVTLEAGRWLVPVDALPRLLGPLLDRPVEWRVAARVLVVGPVDIPRVSVTTFTSGDLTRIVLEASESVPFRVQQESGRVTVTVARDLIDVSLPPMRLSGGIVDSVQFLGGRDNLFAVNLGPRFLKFRASQQESPPRLVLEFHGPPVAAGERPTPPPTPRPAPAPAESAVRTIVIDPGHGGDEVGAQGPGGSYEKDVALSIARKLRAELVNERGLQVFLTRDKDVEVPLDERTAIANNYKADVFVSIHANASRARGAKGSEVYFLSYQASDEETRRMAQQEGMAEPTAHAPAGSDLALILWDMAQAEHLEESSSLASRIQEELAVVTGSEGRGVKQAPFRVLVGATMPAVLVEVAFISNPEEEKLLSSDAYQSKVAAALARGLERYRRERMAALGVSSGGASGPGPLRTPQ
jgi:N-acetylmuramoyl-L-alanine amidase